MSARILSLVTGFARAWTSIYTAGMPVAIRQRRRHEIASDLWECHCEAAHSELTQRDAAREIFTRLVLGMPDDIFWRLENHMNAKSTASPMPGWLNLTELGLPLSAVGLFFAATFSKTLNDTSVASAIRESFYLFPAILTLHMIAIFAFIGCAAMVDLRMLGWTLKRSPVVEVGESLLPIAMGGFILVVFSGIFIYAADAARYAHNAFFNLKVFLLFAGGLNAWVAHRRVFRYSAEWAQTGTVPRRDRIAAGVSLLFWSLLIVSSRLVAFSA